MNNRIFNYQLATSTGLVVHGSKARQLLLRDWGFHRDLKSKHAVDVQVRSGDYFVTLATVLDELARKSKSYAIRAEIESVVSDLIYLQDNYEIVKNDRNVTASDKTSK